MTAASTGLVISNLGVSIENKAILKGLSLRVQRGEVHAIMGPNGSGKSTLASVVLGHPKFSVTQGDICLDGASVLDWSPDERAKKGLFLSFQYPFEVQGLSLSKFLFHAYKARFPTEKVNPLQFQNKLKALLEELQIDPDFAKRDVNVGFSGGEKKRSEIVQLRLLSPDFAILDETDSGLDIDSLKRVAEAVNKMRSPSFGAIVITHYARLLHYLKPDVVHILVDGRIVVSGGFDLAEELEKKGYSKLLQEQGVVLADAVSLR